MWEFLGFNSVESTIWNVIGYGAFIAVICGVLFQRVRKASLFLGPLALVFYAWLFLHNPLLTVMQVLITFSGFAQLIDWRSRAVARILVTGSLVAVAGLALAGQLAAPISWLGVTGFLCLFFGVFGIMPEKPGWFLVLSLSGVLLAVYSGVIQVWVYVFLNAFFAVANFFTWLKAVPKLDAPEVSR